MNPNTVVQDKIYPEMYRLKWPDGVLSEDFYNISRAYDILNNYEDYVDSMQMRGNTRRKDALSLKKEVPYSDLK